jgi:hypothetical protein
MTIVGTHRGTVSGKIHVHLLRESAAERAAKAAAGRRAHGDGIGPEAVTAERSETPWNALSNPQQRAD